MMDEAQKGKKALENVFAFMENVWNDDQEMLIFVTELTIGYHTSRFIARYGCDAYYKHSDSLRLYERKLEILKKGENLWQPNTIL